MTDSGLQLQFDFGDDFSPKEVPGSEYVVDDVAPSQQDRGEQVASAELARLKLEFEMKSDYFLSKELKYSKGVDVHELDMSAFFDEIFLVTKLRHEGRYSAEDIQSHEYLWWLEQKKSKADRIDYSNEGYYMWRYNPIVVYSDYFKGEKVYKHRIMLKDDVVSYNLIESRDFAITAPISYVGRTRHANNARYLYAFAIDLDGVGMEQLKDLLHQQYNDTATSRSTLPKANIIVNSGTGVHLYYILDKPIQLKPGKVQILQKFKHFLTGLIWNPYTSTIKQVQYQGIFQGFRLPGTKTKFGSTIRAFQFLGVEPYSIEELNKYTGPQSNLLLSAKEIQNLYDDDYRSDYTLKYAKENWPDWYEEVIIKGEKKPARRWRVNEALYYWWLKRLRGELEEFSDRPLVGHRYFCLFSLAVFAAKCPKISKERLREDAFSLLEAFDRISDSENNRFTEQDVEDALKANQFAYRTFPRNSIEYLTGLKMPTNRRNGRKQALHLKRARANRDITCEENGKADWREGNGRKKGKTVKASDSPAAKLVKQWRKDHPNNDNKSQCAAETGLTRPTVTKWWGSDFNPQQLVMIWRIKNPDNDNKSQCAKETGLSRHTVIKYWFFK